MIQFFAKRINSKKGFTLVELLVVIAILGLLALIGIPRLGAYRKDAAEAANTATASSIYNGAQAYLARNGNLDGFNYEEYLTGAVPGDADITEPTLTATGDVSAVQVATNSGQWIGVFPPDGTLGTPGSPGGGLTPGQQELLALLATETGDFTSNVYVDGFRIFGSGTRLIEVGGIDGVTISMSDFEGNWESTGSSSALPQRMDQVAQMTVTITDGENTVSQRYNVTVSSVGSSQVYAARTN